VQKQRYWSSFVRRKSQRSCFVKSLACRDLESSCRGMNIRSARRQAFTRWRSPSAVSPHGHDVDGVGAATRLRCAMRFV